MVSALDSGSRVPGSSPGRVIVLCSWAPRSKWVPAKCGEVGYLRWTSIPSRRSSNTSPCSMKILREFYFADWRFFVVCGNIFLRFEMTEISAGNQFLRFSVQVAEKQHISFSTFIVRYLGPHFTLLRY